MNVVIVWILGIAILVYMWRNTAMSRWARRRKVLRPKAASWRHRELMRRIGGGPSIDPHTGEVIDASL